MELSVSSFPVFCQTFVPTPCGNRVTSERFLSVMISFVTRIPPTLFLGGFFILVHVAYSTLVLKKRKITVFLVLNIVGLQEAIMMWTALFSLTVFLLC